MSRFDLPADVPVPIGPCLCPGTPHGDGDVVFLAPVLSAAAGYAAQGAIADAEGDVARVQELLWRIYRDHCITGWNLLDEDGEPVPATAENKDRGLPFAKGGRAVAERADQLYAQDILAPLREQMERLQRSLRGSRKPGPKATSSTPPSTRTRRRSSSTSASEPAPAGG